MAHQRVWFRFDRDKSGVLTDDELKYRNSSSFTDARKKAPAIVLQIDMLEARAGLNFAQVGAGTGMSIVWPLCFWSCDAPGKACKPYFTWYWETGVTIGWQSMNKNDAKTGKKKSFGTMVNIDGMLAGKPKVSLLFFMRQMDREGRAGNIDLGFPKFIKEYAKAAAAKVQDPTKGKAATIGAKLIPDGMAFCFTDPLLALQCDSKHTGMRITAVGLSWSPQLFLGGKTKFLSIENPSTSAPTLGLTLSPTHKDARPTVPPTLRPTAAPTKADKPTPAPTKGTKKDNYLDGLSLSFSK